MRRTWPLLCLLLFCCVSCRPDEPQTVTAQRSLSVESAVAGNARPQKTGISGQEATSHNRLTRDEIAAGWIKLFDGETLLGWKATNDVNWRVADGVITADEGEHGWLNTTTRFSDYQLRCDCWLEKGGNSGIFLRTPFVPQDPSTDCYELNVCDTHPQFPTGSLVARKVSAQQASNDGVWRTYHVTVRGNQITARIDGELVVRFMETRKDSPKQGFIGLQFRTGKVKFRDISLKPLETKAIFNGRDLSGWRVVPGSKSTFDVADGAIHVTGGRGYLETEGAWDDFILQAEILSNGRQLNSGIFFRAMWGTAQAPANGYECQIHNGWHGDDRNQPLDFGTGGIYRRVAARKVVSSDFKWFTTTLIAQGDHFAVWVDAHQVTDWIDDRAPSDNPRKGLRTGAGHFSIQGHDPTTDLSFRNIRIAPLPPRPRKHRE